jgi:hypothetical protein
VGWVADALSPVFFEDRSMKSKSAVLKVITASVLALAGAQARADIIRHFVRHGAWDMHLDENYVALTDAGHWYVTFNGSGRFTIWYTAECAASGYVDVDLWVDGIRLDPVGGDEDSFCDFETRGGMHTVTARTASLADGLHRVWVGGRKSGGVAFLSDSSLLIGK